MKQLDPEDQPSSGENPTQMKNSESKDSKLQRATQVFLGLGLALLIIGIGYSVSRGSTGTMPAPHIDAAVIQVFLFLAGILGYRHFSKQPKKHGWLLLTAALTLVFYALGQISVAYLK